MSPSNSANSLLAIQQGGTMSIQSQMYKMQELYRSVAKERDELQKENESLKRELSYTKYMTEGYKNAVTKLEEEMMEILNSQQVDDDSDNEEEQELKLQSLPEEKPPQINIFQNIKLQSIRSINN